MSIRVAHVPLRVTQDSAVPEVSDFSHRADPQGAFATASRTEGSGLQPRGGMPLRLHHHRARAHWNRADSLQGHERCARLPGGCNQS